VKNSTATLFFRESPGCSKILNDKKYIFNTVKICRAILFFRTSASCSKILNDKIYFNTVKNSRATLFFRASASCSKNPEYQNYIQYSENFQDNSVFQGKRELLKSPEWQNIFQYSKNSRATLFLRASASYSKILNDKKYIFNTVKNSRANSVFQGKRKLLKNSECKKCIPYSENLQGNSAFQDKR